MGARTFALLIVPLLLACPGSPRSDLMAPDAQTELKPAAPRIGQRPEGARGNPNEPPHRGPLPPTYPGDLAKPDQVRVQLDLAAVRAGIQEYRMLNDSKNPPSIGALGLRLSYPEDLTYDAISGTVKSRTYPMW
jgi:hypothetical protein